MPDVEIPWGVKCARCRERQALARQIDGQPVCGHCFYDWLQDSPATSTQQQGGRGQ